MSDNPLNLTRNQLAEFLPNARAVRAFEQLLKQVNNLLPSDVAKLTEMIQDSYLEGSSASQKAEQALDAIERLSQELKIDATTADSKATQALAELRALALSLALIATAPPEQNDNSVSTDYIDFRTTAPAPVHGVGRVSWNDTEGTLEFGLKGGNVTLQIGQENVLRVKNDDTIPLTDGTVVYVSGAAGANPLVKRALADSDITSASTIGIVTETIDVNGQGFVTTFGAVRSLNTSAFNEGDILYLSPTVAGDLTNVKPVAPKHMVTIGFCTKKSSGNGEIFVTVNNGYEIDELHNVLVTAPVLAGSLLIYDATVGVWKNARLTAGTNVTVTNADGAITLSVAGAAPTGAAGGVLSGTYPNPGFAVDMATQAELDAHTTNTSNPHAATKAQVGLGNVTNDAQLKQASNLSDLANAATARTNLGVAIGTNVQAWDADLDAIAALAGTSGLLKKTAANTWTLDTTAYGTGSVTSVGLSVPTGFSVASSPVTTSGTIALSFAAGYSLPTTASQTNWDTAYNDRNKWDGGSTGLVAATGRTSLGLGTIATQNANAVAITGGAIDGTTVGATTRSRGWFAGTGPTTPAISGKQDNPGGHGVTDGAHETFNCSFALSGGTSTDISSIDPGTRWTAIFIGNWCNNYEGGGLSAFGTYQMVDSTNNTLRCGSTPVTVSRNSGTGKLQVTNSTGYASHFTGIVILTGSGISQLPAYSMLTGTVAPNVDNNFSCGSSAYRWSVVYAATGTINTSDANLKTDVAELDEAETRVALRLKKLMRKFRYKDSVEKKGDAARIHVGIMAQELAEAFRAEGLDPSRYAVFCEDEVEEGDQIVKRLGVRYEQLYSFIIAAL